MHIGLIYIFAVVGYKEVRADDEQGRTVFIQIRPYANEGILATDSCGAYTIKTKATKSIRRKEWVHVTRMCTYMYQPPGSEKSPVERKDHVKVVPVAKAFVRD